MPGPATRIADAIGGWIYRHGPASVEEARRRAEDRRDNLRELRSQLTECMARADQDRRHPSEEAADAAVTAAYNAAALVTLLEDDELRSRVAAWKQAFDAARAGHEAFEGPAPARWAQLDEAYRHAIDRLGELYREALRG